MSWRVSTVSALADTEANLAREETLALGAPVRDGRGVARLLTANRQDGCLRKKTSWKSVVKKRLVKKSVPILGQDEEMLGCHSSSIRRVIIKYVPRRGKLLVVTEPVDKPVNYLSESLCAPRAG